jgi:hypothetical protein
MSYNDNETWTITDEGRVLTKKAHVLLDEGWEMDEVANFLGLPSKLHLMILIAMDAGYEF